MKAEHTVLLSKDKPALLSKGSVEQHREMIIPEAFGDDWSTPLSEAYIAHPWELNEAILKRN